MKIFLTGASGFVGSFFLKSLISSGEHDISILLRNPKEAWRIQEVLPKVHVVESGLDRIDIIETELLAQKNYDAFVHLAWTGVLGSERNNHSQWQNVESTMELVKLANRLKVKSFVGLGSQAEYGPSQNKINELYLTKPTTFYGISKLASQLLSERLCAEYGIRYVWLRLFSSFGPTDNSEWLIPYLAKSLIARDKPKLTAAEQFWDYIYVEDVANAIISVINTESAQGIFNLGSGQAYKLKNIIEKIRDVIDPRLVLEFGALEYRPDQVMFLQADISKLTKATGWLPKSNIDLAIKETVSWYIRESL
jgi:UDP-glucose 4-epimerase